MVKNIALCYKDNPLFSGKFLWSGTIFKNKKNAQPDKKSGRFCIDRTSKEDDVD